MPHTRQFLDISKKNIFLELLDFMMIVLKENIVDNQVISIEGRRARRENISSYLQRFLPVYSIRLSKSMSKKKVSYVARTKPTIFSAARSGQVPDIVAILGTGEVDVNDIV